MAQKQDKGTFPGGTHNAGAPTEQVVTRHLRASLAGELARTGGSGGGGMPFKGKNDAAEGSGYMIAETYRGKNADKPGGARAVFILVQAGQDEAQTPVFQIGESAGEALAVFSTREKAILYLQESNWQAKYDSRALAPGQLEQLIEEAMQEGVKTLVVDLNRQGTTQSSPHNFLSLDKMPDRSGEELYRAIWERGNR